MSLMGLKLQKSVNSEDVSYTWLYSSLGNLWEVNKICSTPILCQAVGSVLLVHLIFTTGIITIL